MPPEAFNKRLDREMKKKLGELGFESLEDVKALAAKEKEREQAAMTELDRAKQEKAEAEARAAVAEATAKEAVHSSKVNAACSALGLKNTTYARFLVDQELRENPEADATAVLTKHLESDQMKAALGVAPPQPTPVAVTTTPAPAGGAPPAAADPNPAADNDALKLSDKEWQQKKRELGLL